MTARTCIVAATIALWSLMLTDSAVAGDCDDLAPEQRQLVEQLLASVQPYDCCQQTLAACLDQAHPCPLAVRLERWICRMARAGIGRQAIEASLEHRKRCMTFQGPPARIEYDRRFMAGNEEAPVALAVYACGRSRLCASLVPKLYAEVTAGLFKGKVRLYYRPFFPEGQAEPALCGRALVAAAGQGMFWPFLLHLYAKQDDFKACLLRQWADIKGLDRDSFEMALDHPDTHAYLDASRQEGLANKVETAPTVFINGRKIACDLSGEVLYDLLDEEWERVSR